MKIRTLLIIGLFILAFTPLMVFISLNMPRVLNQFKVAEADRQLLLIQGNAREITMTLKWKQDSLRALSFNMGAVELANNQSTDFPVQIIRKRVKKMLVQWYQDNPEVLAIRFFDRQGVERFAVGRGDDGGLIELPGRQVSSCPPSLIALADLHPGVLSITPVLNLAQNMGVNHYP